MKEFQIENYVDPNQFLDGEKEVGKETKDLPYIKTFICSNPMRASISKNATSFSMLS